MENVIIVIDGGDTFEGDIEMFKNCFFSNATKETIENWCEKQGSTVEFKNSNS